VKFEGLIHVDLETVDVNSCFRVEEDPEFIVLIWATRWIELIRPYSSSRPNNACS
jgi:hypothetical protein